MDRRHRITIATAIGLAAALTFPAAGVALADDTPPELVSVDVSTPQVDVGNSYGMGQAVVSVHLRDAEGLPDTIQVECCTDNMSVASAIRDAELPEMPWIIWYTLGRSSGTRQDGVWSGQVTVSPAWSGTYKVSAVQVDDDQNGQFSFPVPDGPTITVSGGERWMASTIRTPMRIVSGNETWRPQAQVRNTVTGAALGGARIAVYSRFQDWTSHAFTGGPGEQPPGTAANSAGIWTSPIAYTVRGGLGGDERTLVYGRRGTRGYSEQGAGCIDFTLKMQASATYSAATLGAGQPVTVTGNIWPAPSILESQTVVNLQRDLGGGNWQNVATANPRINGRYTIGWTPPAAGTYSLRARIPGRGDAAPCGGQQAIGTNLAATSLTVR